MNGRTFSKNPRKRGKSHHHYHHLASRSRLASDHNDNKPISLLQRKEIFQNALSSMRRFADSKIQFGTWHQSAARCNTAEF